ncbi:zeta toxin family protein [Pseudomonas protegens]|uniref:zeta toxin family protein n=1 Tax=Pseudomonas protegens TaxID=380021 RepID=UPI00276328D4|nr:zeta toxin family protein [Pseudomonas protegens]MDP9525805.1 zeta toxin family protein [Pseudomonas protegens]
MAVPRLRVFAGPNGSGKSTIKSDLNPALIKAYVNADELEKEAKATGFIDLAIFGIDIALPELHAFHAQHYLIIRKGLTEQAEKLGLLQTKVDYRNVRVDSYLTSVLSDFIRQHLLDKGVSFTFETVMSHPSKVEFMREARARGYRTYLYFVSTEDPEINVDRVAIRVQEGGHPVEPEKVRERYIKSLNLLPEAVATSNRAYLFDNSGDSAVLLAEITDGTQLEYRTEEVPQWLFEYYVDKVDI